MTNEKHSRPDQDRAPVEGWQGRYFEDFAVGDVYRHPLGRTVLETDNSWMTLLTQNTAPLHFDRHYSAQTVWGRPWWTPPSPWPW